MRSPGLLYSLLLLLLSGSAFAQTIDCQEVPGVNPGDQLGCSVATDGARSVFGANMGNGGRGSVTVSGSPTVVATDGAPGDQFGFATVIQGDTLIVGAPTADVQGRQDAGAVYIFQRDDGAWVQQAKVTAPDAAAGAQFGFSLAFDGEFLAVGAPRDGARGSFSGAVYIFEKRGKEWVQSAKLTSGRTKPFDEFGYAVAVSNSTLVVGAPFADGRAGGNQGAVHLFERNGWTEKDMLVTSSTAAGDELGGAVALDGGTLAVGARRADVGGAVDAGAVYIFESAGRVWRERARLTGPGGGARDLFGGAVGLDDGHLVAGASQADAGAGLAYVFKKNEAGAWHFQEILRPAAGGRFGFSIALHGDTVVIGAFMARGNAGSAVTCEIDPQPLEAALDLTLEVPDSAEPGDQITYILTVTNHGPATATGVVLKAPIPKGLQLGGARPPANCTVQDGTVTCSLGDIAQDPKGKEVKIDWTVLSSCAAEIVNDAATVKAENAPLEDSEPPPTALLLTADLEVTKTAPSTAQRGNAISYDLTVTNHGPHCARGAVLTDVIPTGLSSPSLSSSCGLSAERVRCPLGDLPPLAERALTLRFRTAPAAVGAIVNTATVSTRSTDPNPESSSSTARTAIVSSGASEIPALSRTALLALALLLAALALLRLRRRRAP